MLNPERFESIVEKERSILDRIGNTPLLPLRRVTAGLRGVEIWGKAEWFNPGGSVKDRPALRMILEGERSGLLRQGKTIIDATSGNTGIAYALIGAVKGYSVELVTPQNVSEERKRIARIYGAELTLTDPLEGIDGAILEARRRVEAYPDRYFYPDQYNNSANLLAHYETTGPEIWEETQGQVTHFVVGVGTSGTLMGAGRYLREKNPQVELIEIQPADELQIIEGLKHMATSLVPGIYDAHFASRRISVSAEEAYQMAQLLAREEGLLVGLSAGAAVWAALQVAKDAKDALIVAILPDGGDRYLSLNFGLGGKAQKKSPGIV